MFWWGSSSSPLPFTDWGSRPVGRWHDGKHRGEPDLFREKESHHLRHAIGTLIQNFLTCILAAIEVGS